MIPKLSLLECIKCSSSLSLEEIKLLAIVSWIFQISNFLRSNSISFKYGLFSLRYFSSDSVLFLSLLFSCSIQFLLQTYLLLLVLVYHNFLFPDQKGPWFSLLSLKWFLMLLLALSFLFLAPKNFYLNNVIFSFLSFSSPFFFSKYNFKFIFWALYHLN